MDQLINTMHVIVSLHTAACQLNKLSSYDGWPFSQIDLGHLRRTDFEPSTDR